VYIGISLQEKLPPLNFMRFGGHNYNNIWDFSFDEDKKPGETGT
jgi:hypothetical protein